MEVFICHLKYSVNGKTERQTVNMHTRLLRESIMSFKLLPGEALDETVISEQFGTSRTPVREALILLKNEKLVDILPQKEARSALSI